MRRGFTILEVLVALAIFAGAAVMLSATYLNILNGYALIEHESDNQNEIKFARAMLRTRYLYHCVSSAFCTGVANRVAISHCPPEATSW